MNVVYWTHRRGSGKLVAFRKEISDLSPMIKFAEKLRQAEIKIGKVSFIGTVCANSDNVGRPGVADVGPDYDWNKKRDRFSKLNRSFQKIEQ